MPEQEQEASKKSDHDLPVYRVVLIGMPGAGKSRIGWEISKMLGATFIDTDEEIVAREGRSISDIFAQDGQEAFRIIEQTLIDQLLDQSLKSNKSQVLALGGGALTHPQTAQAVEHFAAQGGSVVYLDTDPDDAIEHAVRRKGARPLLEDDPRGTWMKLYRQRSDQYIRLSTVRVSTRGKTPQGTAATVMDALREKRITVKNRDGDYQVVVGSNLFMHIPQVLSSWHPEPNKIGLIHTAPTQAHSDKVRGILRQHGYQVVEMVIPDAEKGKTIQTLSTVWKKLGLEGFTRSDALIGLGGGAATDAAGFAAATWMRGISYINCPTSLLAMVDASVGGKTGINTAQGKNLVGSFYTPRLVLSDVETLKTLPADIFTEGLGEVVKCGFIADPSLVDILENNASWLKNCIPATLTEDQVAVVTDLIERSVRVKAAYVGKDFTEQGLREFLNYGHTLGHVIELMEGFTVRHGQAVSVGMVFAAELARIEGLIDDDLVDRHRRVLASLGLQTSWRVPDPDKVIALMHRDKKARGPLVRFVVLHGLGQPDHLDGPDERDIREALRRISTSSQDSTSATMTGVGKTVVRKTAA